MDDRFARWDTPTDADLEAYARLMAAAFGSTPERSARWLGRVGPHRARIALIDDQLAAALGSYDMGHFFGGRSVPCAGVAGVAVQPHHRRKGLGASIMERFLVESHDQGLALASLYAANHPLYRRVGFELAGAYAEAGIAPDRIAVREPSGSLRPIAEDEDAVRFELYRRMAQARAGHLDREAGLWRRATHDRDDAPLACWLAESPDGKPEGYVTLRPGPGTGISQRLTAVDLVAVSPWAVRKLLSFLADHASVVEELRFPSGPSCPFLRSLPEPRVAWHQNLGWMLRIVCLKPALEGRGWPSAVSAKIELELDDPLLPDNSGRWVLELEDGRMRVRKGGRGLVRTGPRGLATIYSGHVSPVEAAAVGLLEGPDDALADLGAALAGPAPWVMEMY